MKSIDPHGSDVGRAVVGGATVAPVVTAVAGFAGLDVVPAVAVVVVVAVVTTVETDDSGGAVVPGATDDVVTGKVVADVVALLEHALEMTASATKPSAALLPRIVMLKG
jgi:hypothetical protein